MDERTLRADLLELLDGVGAHMTFEDAVADFPDDAINVRAPNVEYTPWHLVEHLRITQWDILEYVRNPEHVSPEWPREYWPPRNALATVEQFGASVAGFLADKAALRAIAADPATDLTAVLPHTPGHTVLREVRIAADHNAYHVGEFAVLRQVMATWPASRGDG
ncbi:MAG TPA: DinB family protein [Candidatus Limnocylindrales bacterium]